MVRNRSRCCSRTRRDWFAKRFGPCLENAHDIVVVAEAADGMQAIAEAERTRPDVALVDADLPNRDSTHTTLAIRERVPGCRVLVLSERSR